MFTGDQLNSWVAIQDRVDNEEHYNWYIHNIGTTGLMSMYDIKYSNKPNSIDKNKSKEYNLINKEYSGVIREIAEYQRTLMDPIKDIRRKLRDIDRINPNNFEDYSLMMDQFSKFKNQELSAIVQKATLIKNKHDSLMKITKQENDALGGNGNAGGSDSISNMARLLGALPSGGAQAPTQQYQTSVVNGNSRPDMNSMNSGSPETAEYTEIVKREEALAAARNREQLVTGNGQDIGASSKTEAIDPYTVAITKYSPDVIKEKYMIQPSTGYGYIQFETPDGEKGIKKTPIRNFQESFVDYSNRSVLDATRKTYEIVEVDSIPADIEAQWRDVFPEFNRLGTKK